MCFVFSFFFTHSFPRTNANRTLETFRRTPNAWVYCDKILQNPSLAPAFVHWAATTMDFKMKCDFRDLPASSYVPLRDSLLGAMVALARQGDRSAVVNALAGAVATLAVQMPAAAWPDPVGDLVGAGAGAGAAQCDVALAVVRRLPEECASSRVRVANARRSECAMYLDGQVPRVLAWLVAVLAAPDGAARARPVLQCLESWLHSCSVGPAQLRGSPLVGAVYEALAQPALAEAAADCAVSLVQSVCTRPDDAVAQFVLARVGALGALYQAAAARGDAATCRSVARVFAETGESFAAHLVRGTRESMVLAGVLLHAAAASAPDADNLAYDYFHALARQIVISLPEERAGLAAPFVPVYQDFARIVLQKMVLPADYAELTDDEREEVHAFRHYDLTQGLRDCSSVMGVDALLALVHGAFADECARYAAGTTDWRGMEAALFAVRVLARCVDVAEHTDVLPRILARIPALPPVPLLQYTAILVVGRYAEWLRKNPASLAPLLPFVTAALAEPARQDAAALAFQRICSACAPQLAPSIDSLVALYEQCAHVHIAPTNSDELLRGLARVISVLPPDRAVPALQRLCTPPATLLQSFVPQLASLPAPGIGTSAVGTAVVGAGSGTGTTTTSGTTEWMKPVVDAFHVLGSLFRYVDVGDTMGVGASPTSTTPGTGTPGQDVNGTTTSEPHPVLTVMQTLWPTIAEPFFGAFGVLPDEVVYELCRFCRCAVVACGCRVAPLLAALLRCATGAYAARQHSDVLFLVNELVHTLGVRDAFDAPLAAALAALSETTFATLRAPDARADSPQLVQEYFALCTKGVERLAPTLLRGPAHRPLVARTVAYAAHVLPTTHNSLEGVRAALGFLTRLFSAGKKPEFADTVTAALAAAGPALTHALVACVGGCQPAALHKDLCTVLTTLRRLNPAALLTWLCFTLGVPLPAGAAPCLAPAPPAAPAPLPFAVEPTVAQLFIQELYSAKRECNALEAVELFGNECRRGWNSPDPIC